MTTSLKSLLPLAVLAAPILAAASAHAQTTLNFDSLSAGSKATGFEDLGSTYSTQGFTLTSGNGQFFAFNGTNASYGDGETSLYSNAAGSTALTLTSIAGGTFAFNAIDLGHLPFAVSQTNDVDEPILFTGIEANGTTVTALEDYKPAIGFGTFQFTGFTDLKSLSFVPVNGTLGNPVQFDNIKLNQPAVSTVPEPASWLTLALGGLGVMGLMLKARKHKGVSATILSA